MLLQATPINFISSKNCLSPGPATNFWPKSVCPCFRIEVNKKRGFVNGSRIQSSLTESAILWAGRVFIHYALLKVGLAGSSASPRVPSGKQWRRTQIQKISDKVFDRVKNETGHDNLTFEDLYIAVLLVYNEINKRLPGPHFDPPSKEQVKTLMQECDFNLDGVLNRAEFVKFIKHSTKDTFFVVSQGLIVTLAVAPTVALLTKRSTEGIPHVGRIVQKLPTSVYASIITLAVVLFQNSSQAIE